MDVLAAKGATPPLGIARYPIDGVIENAVNKQARRVIFGESSEPAKMSRVQSCRNRLRVQRR